MRFISRGRVTCRGCPGFWLSLAPDGPRRGCAVVYERDLDAQTRLELLRGHVVDLPLAADQVHDTIWACFTARELRYFAHIM